MRGRRKNPKSIITIGQLADTKLSKILKKEFVADFAKEFDIEEQTVYLFLKKRDILNRAKFVADRLTDGSLDELYNQLHNIQTKVKF